MENKYTTIAISNENWRRLLSLRETPKETFNDVIKRLIQQVGKND